MERGFQALSLQREAAGDHRASAGPGGSLCHEGASHARAEGLVLGHREGQPEDAEPLPSRDGEAGHCGEVLKTKTKDNNKKQKSKQKKKEQNFFFLSSSKFETVGQRFEGNTQRWFRLLWFIGMTTRRWAPTPKSPHISSSATMTVATQLRTETALTTAPTVPIKIKSVSVLAVAVLV